jgi:hypothetical protein
MRTAIIALAAASIALAAPARASEAVDKMLRGAADIIVYSEYCDDVDHPNLPELPANVFHGANETLKSAGLLEMKANILAEEARYDKDHDGFCNAIAASILIATSHSGN